MPYFQVLLHGDGVRISGEDPKWDIVGFYTTRTVRAVDKKKAIEAACASVQKEWLKREYVANNSGGPPILTVESIEPSTVWAWLRARNMGHSFYGPDEGQT